MLKESLLINVEWRQMFLRRVVGSGAPETPYVAVEVDVRSDETHWIATTARADELLRLEFTTQWSKRAYLVCTWSKLLYLE